MNHDAISYIAPWVRHEQFVRMEPFATNLRKRAKELGLSNAEVARRARLSERRYGNYVSGRRESDLATLVRIASVLATTPNDLLIDRIVSPTPEEFFRQRASCCLRGPSQDDVEIVTIMVEALAAERR